MKCITLLTDFGLRDGYAGVMKGVIWKIAPDARIADLTHTIAPQNIQEGALALDRAVAYFPAGTVHVAVVDPGVGTHRRPIAARLGECYFVGPDNGLMTLLLEKAEQSGGPVQVVHLDRPEYWLAQVSNVFHGRDIFSPVAAHLVNGAPLEKVGTPLLDPVRLQIPRAAAVADGWRGQIIHIDAFGNLQTNLESRHVCGLRVTSINGPGYRLEGLSKTFGDAAPGELVAMIDSSDHISIAVVNGSAQSRLDARVGDAVVLLGEKINDD